MCPTGHPRPSALSGTDGRGGCGGFWPRTCENLLSGRHLQLQYECLLLKESIRQEEGERPEMWPAFQNPRGRVGEGYFDPGISEDARTFASLFPGIVYSENI